MLCRELLSTSDTVIGIHATAKSIQSLVGSIQAKMGALSQTGASEEGEGQGGHDGANAVYGKVVVKVWWNVEGPFV